MGNSKKDQITKIEDAVVSRATWANVEREKALKKAKQIALAFNIWGSIAGFATLIINNQYTCFCLQMAVLITGLLIIAFSTGQTRFLPDKKGRLATVALGIGLTGIVMLIVTIGDSAYHINGKYGLLCTLIIIASILIFLPLKIFSRNPDVGKGDTMLIMMVSLLYGFGSITQINCLFDRSSPQTYTSVIEEKYTTTGKGAHYHIRIKPWQSDGRSRSIDIRKSEYERTTLGQPITIFVKQGLFNIPWFYTKL